jgi:MoaA/NifB/PqqE/SkfB family radical SAM enzyme
MTRSTEKMLAREQIANRPKHWVRLVTACNNTCLFCLDMDTPRNQYLGEAEIKAELDRGFHELGADKVILSGGEASVHPLFPEFIRYARALGYERVQTVTNGMRYGDRKFFDSLMAAGLNEITFSLHGHTAGLHDYLVQTPGAFQKLIRGLMRAVRHRSQHGWPIVNIDVVINKQNVAVIDKIVELGVRLGIKEYDLLHVIPQAEAYRQRDLMFYDVREHLPTLQRVFMLNRRPDFHIWTNRFPVAYLEGLEDLIQDPHKMLDEVRGRRFHVRRYLDAGEPLECREPDRCVHCFIEPFCTTMERTVRDQNAAAFQVFDVGRLDWTEALPHGATQLGVTRETVEGLPAGDLVIRLDTPCALDALPPGRHTLVATSAAHCQAWIGHDDLVIELTQDTAPWLLANRDRLDGVRIDQPTYETLEQANDHDVRDVAGFFRDLGLRLAVSGLPACMAPGTMLHPGVRTLRLDCFDAERGRLDWKRLASHHVTRVYSAKSVRCGDCRVTERCEGLHINAIRDQGLGQLSPLIEGDWADEAEAQLASLPVPDRIAAGLPIQPVAPSLPGHGPPEPPPEDPLRQANAIRRSDFLKPGRGLV